MWEVAGRNYNSRQLQFPRKNDIGSSLIPCFVSVHVSFMFFVFESDDGALVEQELLTFPEHLISPQIISGFVSLNVCLLCVFFNLFLSFFIWSFYCLSFFDIPLLIIPLAFPNFCSFSDKQTNINTFKNTSWNKCVMNMACLLLLYVTFISQSDSSKSAKHINVDRQ